MSDFSGATIGKYQIVAQLGSGGMATVYQAYDTRLECDVAIKFIRRESFPPDSMATLLRRFEREARVLAKLNHPNIVSIMDFGEHDGSPYLVMRFMPGGTLKEKLGQAWPVEEAARMLLPVARALDYAHSEGILHRDVKPANILLTKTGEPVLSDFGIARLVEAGQGQTLTGTGVGIGTPEYMAPEQGMGQEIDARADLYSLGIVLYELVTGRKPFTARTPMEVVVKHLTAPLPSPRQFNPGLSDDAVAVIEQSLAKLPEDRYAGMAQFAGALESLIPRTPTPAPRRIFPSRVEEEARAAEAPPVPAAPEERPPEAAAFVAAQVAEPNLPGSSQEEATVDYQNRQAAARPADEVPAPDMARLGDPGEPARVSRARPVAPAQRVQQFRLAWTWVIGGVILLGLAGVVGIFLAVRAGKIFQPAPTAAQPAPTVTRLALAGEGMKLCQVADTTGMEANSFNAITWKGVEKAKTELGFEIKYLEPKQDSDYEQIINAFIAEKCDLIVTANFFLLDATKAAAEAHPDQKFAIVDTFFEPPVPNILELTFQSDQAAFLAGYLAAGMTKTGKVGTYGGLNIPPVTVFMEGFFHGVQYYNRTKGTTVQVIGWDPATQQGLFINNFDDIDSGRAMGEMLLREGVDVILAVAGVADRGTTEVVSAAGNAWVIGYDIDFTAARPEYRDVVLTSAIKKIDQAVLDAARNVANGSFRGGVYQGTLQNDGVGLGEISPAVPVELLDQVEALRLKIISGEVQVPARP